SRPHAPVQGGVDRKSGAQSLDGAPHALLRCGIAARVLRQALQDFADPRPDLAEFRSAEAPRRRRGRAQANARGDRWFLRVERDAVLVAGDPGALQGLLRVATG